MKKNNLFLFLMTISLNLFFQSCYQERELTELEKTSTENLQKHDPEYESVCDYFIRGYQSSIIPGVKSIVMYNGLTTTCTTNILVFNTINDYENAISLLDRNIDSHNKQFDILTSGMTDVEADDYADATGFDEDKPLRDFENGIMFCSLGKSLLDLENQWLDQQGDGAWDLETDPDNYHVDDNTERSLLSVGSEFIVGNCETGYTLHKKFDWGYVTIPITNVNTILNAMRVFNNASNIEQVPFNINGLGQNEVIKILQNSGFDCDIPTVSAGPRSCYTIVTNQPSNTNTSCKSFVKDQGEHLFSSDRKILWKHKFKEARFPNVSSTTLVKTNTKSFRKKRGKWKAYKATIFAGHKGSFANFYNNCTDLGDGGERGKQKRRKKVKERYYYPVNANVNQNKAFSVHKQEGNVYTNEIY